MHTGVASIIYTQRGLVLEDAFARHPNRFKHRRPQPPAIPTEAGINMPNNSSGDDTIAKITH
jgi:putative transposase